MSMIVPGFLYAQPFPDPDSMKNLEINISASQPAFNYPETLVISFNESKDGIVSYSGLNVQGQENSWQMHMPTQKKISMSEQNSILLELQNADWLRMSDISENDFRQSPFLIRIKLSWTDSRGGSKEFYIYPKTLNTKVFPLYITDEDTDYNRYLKFIDAITNKYSGHSFLDTLGCRYD